MFSFEDMRTRYSRSPRLRGLRKEFREEWEWREIPPKPRSKGVWRLADEGKCWKDISSNAADIPDMIVPIRWTQLLRVSRACHDKAIQVTEVEAKEEEKETQEDAECCILNLYPTLPPAIAVLYRHPPLGDPLIPVILVPSQTNHTGAPAVSCTTALKTHTSVTGKPAVPSATCLQSNSTTTDLPTSGLHSHTSVTGLHDVSSTSSHQPHCSATDFLTGSGTVGFRSNCSVTGTPAQLGTTDSPSGSSSSSYTFEGLRIPTIEQSLQGPSTGYLYAGGLEQCTKVERETETLPRQSSTQNVSTDVKALEQVPSNEPSAKCPSTEYFVTKPASKVIVTEVLRANVRRLEEGPSTSEPLGKRVQEEDESVFLMSPKRYLNTRDVPSVKCVQTSRNTKAQDEAPSEGLPNAVTKRSTRMVKVPRRMDL